jgi:glycosyltransferase involved in cell wall biosynthesis
MKILNAHKWDSASGGAGRFYVNHEKIMVARGHHVVPWASNYSGNRTDESNQAQFAPKSVAFSEFENLGLIAKTGVGASVVWNAAAAKALVIAINHHKPEVIHFHNIYHQLSGAVLEAALQSGIPVVQSLHDFSHFCTQSHFYRRGAPCFDCLEKGSYSGIRNKCFNGSLPGSILTAFSRFIVERKGLLAKLAGYTTPSEEVKEILVRCGLSREKILVVDNPFLADDMPINLAEAAPVGNHLAAWGTFAEMKGFGTLLDALEYMPATTTIKLYAKDAHAASPLLREKVARMVASGRLELIEGVRYGETLFNLLATARVLVVPSEWPVTQEYTVWEGMLLGRPVVVGDRGGNKELVGDPDLVFRAGDAVSLASVLTRLLGYGEEQLTSIGSGLKCRAVAKGDPSVYAEKIERFYDDFC